MPTTCFFVERQDKVRVYLRRYVTYSNCPAEKDGYHHFMNLYAEVSCTYDEHGYLHFPPLCIPRNHPKWPTKCLCGYAFSDNDEWQEFPQVVYKEVGGKGKEYTERNLPVGAMFYAHWLPQKFFWTNGEGNCLMVVTPGGEWNIDGRARNCSSPMERTHRCWIRHGEPPNVTVDKHGLTCQAGGGSIQQKMYHGFLSNGILT